MESPVPNKKPSYLTFPEALMAVMQGKKITREEWANKEEYAYLKGEALVFHTVGDQYKDGYWGIRSVDMLNNDWIVIEP